MNMQPRTEAERARTAPARRAGSSWLTDAGYVVFLVLIFVGLEPFTSRETTAATVGGGGDTLRQISFLSVFAVIAATALWKQGFAALRAISIPVVLTIAWCVASAIWSIEADVTLRRIVLASVVMLSALLAVESVGMERALRLLRYVLAGILIVNWISVFLLPEAVHLPGDPEPSVVGDWRGLYFHKNIAGAVSAISAILFLFFALRFRRWIDIALCVAAIGFTIMTQSKTSMGFLAVSLIAAAFYRLMGRGGVDRMIGVVALGLVATVSLAVVLSYWDTIAAALSDPTQFTGRAAIWQAEVAHIADHPLLGSGFGSFADTGARSPLYPYMGDRWIATVSHGHSGYLELAVTIGLVGLALALLAFVVQPLFDFSVIAAGQTLFTTLAFTVFVFVVLHNLMESDFLQGDTPQWIALLLVIGMARAERREVRSWS